jgi:hypothetical protein
MSDSFQLSFSSGNFGDFTMHADSNDLAFSVGTNSYFSPSFLADCLSSHISKFPSVDPTIHQFVIQTPDPRDDFISFLAFGAGYTFLVNFNNAILFGSFCREFANVDILQSISHSNGESLNCQTVIRQFVLLCELCGNCEQEIGFCASHFYGFFSISVSDFFPEIIQTKQ